MYYKAIANGNNCGIYKITSPSGKVYIGSSANIKRRFNDYRLLRCKNQTKLYNSFLKYGADKHLFEIIHICERIDLYKNERLLGIEYNVLGENGLNLQLPNDGELPQIQSKELKDKKRIIQTGKKYSEASKNKMSLAKKGKPSNSPTKFKKGMMAYNKGKVMPDDVKEKLRLANVGKNLTEEHKQKIREASKNRIWSDESKNKLSKSKQGHIVSDETRVKISNANTGKENKNRIKIFIISPINNDIIVFDSITNASNVLGIKRTNISNNLNGYSKYVNSTQYGKIKFEYYD